MSNSAMTIVVVALYLVAVTWIGWQGRRLAANSDMFNIFGRRARTVRAAAGYLSLVGGGELVTITQLGYENGFSVFWFLGGITAGFLGLMLWSRRIKAIAYDRRINTFSGFFFDQFGRAAGIAVTLIFLISLGSLLTIQFIVGSDLLAVSTGVPATLSMIIMAGVILSYLLPAGLVAVLSTDVLRSFLMTIILAVISAVVVFYAPQPVITSSATKFVALPITEGTTLFVLGFFGAVCAADVWQTIFAAESDKVVRKSLFVGAAAFFLIGSMIAAMGMATKGAVPIIADGSSAFVVMAGQVIPGVFAPLLALMIVGSVMATADTEIWVISTVLVSNIFPTSNSDGDGAPQDSPSSDRIRKATRVLIPIITVLSVVTAYYSRSAQDMYQGLLVLLTSMAPVVAVVLATSPPRAIVTYGLWAGLATFFSLSAWWGFAIPLEQSLLPAGGTLVGMAIGAVHTCVDQSMRKAGPM